MTEKQIESIEKLIDLKICEALSSMSFHKPNTIPSTDWEQTSLLSDIKKELLQ